MTDPATNPATHAAKGMPCPVCTVPLLMSERQGVEIDYCPQCRGVWLDRGELDKIIQRTVELDVTPLVAQPPAPAAYAPPSAPPHYHHQQQHQHQQSYDQGGYRPDRKGYPKRKKSFLEELFD